MSQEIDQHDKRCYAPDECPYPDDMCDKCKYNWCTCVKCEEKRKP